MRAQFVPMDGGAPVEVVKEMILVGRGEECDLRLDHKSVSKMHCVVVKTDGLLVLRDLGSTNGTRVNGTRVRRAALLPNDRVSFANFHYRVLFGAPLLEAEEANHTQRLQADDLEKALPKEPSVQVQKNSLPDVYEEGK
jgi:pSer/pThr/pTyr-binding forkhead associated (FHA) protein